MPLTTYLRALYRSGPVRNAIISLFLEVRASQFGVFWCVVVVVGLFSTRWVLVLPSIGMACLFVTSVGYALAQRKIARRAKMRFF